MGFLNKVKNIFFEEEIVEIEDEPKKIKKEEPVAKKIELPKVEKSAKEGSNYEDYEENEIASEEKAVAKESKFPMDFNVDDFKEETEEFDEDVYQKPAISRRRDRKEEPVHEEEIVEEEQDGNDIKYDFELEYGREKDKEKEHGLYEGKNTKKAFIPTPIISPIYGILDKNYKKDDIVTKKEIRLSSSSKKIDLDTVREKAYGDLSNDISQSIEEVVEKKYIQEDSDIVDLTDDDLLYDLNDNSTPAAVQKVTVGDAEEYFNELGLEYNIDYEDTNVTKRRATTSEDNSIVEKGGKKSKEKAVESENDEEDSKSDGIESNLFDLIESMYDEKE